MSTAGAQVVRAELSPRPWKEYSNSRFTYPEGGKAPERIQREMLILLLLNFFGASLAQRIIKYARVIVKYF